MRAGFGCRIRTPFETRPLICEGPDPVPGRDCATFPRLVPGAPRKPGSQQNQLASAPQARLPASILTMECAWFVPPGSACANCHEALRMAYIRLYERERVAKRSLPG